MPAPFVGRDDGQRLDPIEPLRVDLLQQVPESVQIIGDFGQKRLVDLEADGAAQALDIVLREISHPIPSRLLSL
jgi:hypothetical protein